jgi:hypothetical protein
MSGKKGTEFTKRVSIPHKILFPFLIALPRQEHVLVKAVKIEKKKS